MKKNLFIFLSVAVLFSSGCADMEVPGPRQVLTNPIGTSAVKIGMSKAQVLQIYGEPNFKAEAVSDEWEGLREEWFYNARLSALPVGAGYLTNNVYLYFDGNSLTKISERSLGKSSEE